MNKIKWLLILLVIFLGRCAYYPPAPSVSELGPDIRIGIAEQLSGLSFETNGPIAIWDQHDQLLVDNASSRRWRVVLADAAPVTILYRLLHREVDNAEVGRQVIDNLERRGIFATIKTIQRRRYVNKSLQNITYYQILLKPIFETEADARQYQQSLAGSISTSILPFFNERPAGRVILINEQTKEQFVSGGLLRIRGNQFAFEVKAGEGFHFEKAETRTYQQQLEFWIDRFGKLTVVNVLPLELYLRGVVGSEMHPQFPLEALKSQAVAARSYTLARLGKQHRLSPFDVCDEVHCHVYGGVGRESEAVNEAVQATAGRVLVAEDQICDAFYASVCGGHSEHNENVWNSDPLPYLRGHADWRGGSSTLDYDLTEESQVRRWIETRPASFCNTDGLDIPEAMNYTLRYFRWQVQYTAEELGRIIRNKTGENIGTVLEIIPQERGVSGRLKKIAVRGILKTISISGELAIRNALSPNYLYSSCFIAQREGQNITLKGAGWGHGVGMCQTGAAVMALKKYDYRQILNHYYRNSQLIKLY
ncbi:MAG: SpoIID/LytB domain-containing protein [candidate division KSB1 bacterium]|nr:SpoIID/LytB domain-containing protein [candidate division KSB1 bacterium]